MGFSVVSASIIVVAALLAGFSMLLSSLVAQVSGLKEGVDGSTRSLSSPERLTIMNATLVQPSTLEVVVANNGSKVIWDLDSMDLIVSYVTQAGSRVTEVLAYGSGWVLREVIVNGGVRLDATGRPWINPSEAAVIEATLSSQPQQGSVIVVVIVSPGGSVAHYRFVG